jgi:hypothetical protein
LWLTKADGSNLFKKLELGFFRAKGYPIIGYIIDHYKKQHGDYSSCYNAYDRMIAWFLHIIASD